MRLTDRLITAVLACVCTAACTPLVFDDPIALMLDRNADPRLQRLATQQAKTQYPNDPKRLTALRQLLWHNDYPAWQRCDALKQLAQINEAELIDTVSQRINQIQNTAVLKCLFDVAVSRNWPGTTALAVSSYARPSPNQADTDRLERRVIQSLNPDTPIQRVVYEVFTDTHPNPASHTQQAAAWQLLNRLATPAASRDMLTHTPPTTPLIADLQAAAANLNTVPTNREGVRWLAWLRAPAQRAFWHHATNAVTKLTTPQRAHLELRHLATLLHHSDAVLPAPGLTTNRSLRAATVRKRSLQTFTPTQNFSNDALPPNRQHLLNTLIARDQLGEHFYIPHKDGQLPIPSQKLEHWAHNLSWADLVTIDLLTKAVRHTPVTESLFTQADADLNDPHSEHGGVLDKQNDSFLTLPYDPLVRRHDRVFYPSPEMVEHLYTALAHYHFHAQQHDNHPYAGPGRGDLRFAKRMNFNCLVFTFVNPDTLNVDYYQPNGTVVDLGSIKRPK